MSDLIPYEARGSLSGGLHAPRPGAFPEAYPEAADEPAGLREYLRVLRRQWKVALPIFLAIVAAAAYLVITATPRYRAVSVVRIADTRRALTGGAGSEMSDVIGRETDVLLSQIQVLQSRQLAGQAVKRAGLRFMPSAPAMHVPEIQAVQVSDSAVADSVTMRFGADGVSASDGSVSVTAAYGAPLQIGGVTFVTARQPAISDATYRILPADQAIQMLLDNFRAVPRPKTDIIDLAYVSGEPHIAQSVANALALTFQAYSGQAAQDQSRRRRIFLEEQLSQTDMLLRNAMASYSGYRSGKQVVSSQQMGAEQQSGLVNVEMRRAELDAQRRTYQSLLSQAERSRGSDGGLRSLVSAPGIAANPVIQQLYGQLANYEMIRDSLTTGGAAAENPDVQALNTMIASTSSRIMDAVRSQITQLNASIAALDNLKERSSAQIALLPGTETQEAQLNQQVQTFQKIADQLQGELQKAKISEAVETGSVQIVDLADLPSMPMSTGGVRKIALGILLGLMVAFGAASLVDGMNTSIRHRTDVERVLQVPGLAIIPRFASAGGRAKLLPGKSGRKNGASPPSRGPLLDDLVTVSAGQSASAEAYRTLRTNLIFSQSISTLRTLVVSSASPSEGKTTTAANLAVSFAQQGMRVLIVDCDLRRARLHRMFGISREPGLTELVLEREQQEVAVRETSIVGLYVLPSGQLPPNPAELLGGDRMRRTLATLVESFDLVVIDTPPLLAASDAAILATMADGVVMVVRAGATESEAAQQALQQLNSVGARIVGAVLNDPDSKLSQYGGYYKYEYSNT